MHVERRCPQRTALVLGILVVELTGLHGARIGVLQTELNNYPNSHMFGLEKVSNELVARGHEVVVRRALHGRLSSSFAFFSLRSALFARCD